MVRARFLEALCLLSPGIQSPLSRIPTPNTTITETPTTTARIGIGSAIQSHSSIQYTHSNPYTNAVAGVVVRREAVDEDEVVAEAVDVEEAGAEAGEEAVEEAVPWDVAERPYGSSHVVLYMPWGRCFI